MLWSPWSLDATVTAPQSDHRGARDTNCTPYSKCHELLMQLTTMCNAARFLHNGKNGPNNQQTTLATTNPMGSTANLLKRLCVVTKPCNGPVLHCGILKSLKLQQQIWGHESTSFAPTANLKKGRHAIIASSGVCHKCQMQHQNEVMQITCLIAPYGLTCKASPCSLESSTQDLATVGMPMPIWH